jgi:alkylated DNA nucleotide flippase Atl1
MDGKGDDRAAVASATARLRLVDAWSGAATTSHVPLRELDAFEHGLAVGLSFYPWHRVVSYEWEVATEGPVKHPGPRQRFVRLAYDDAGTRREHVVPANGFELGPWTVTAMLPDRVEPEARRAVFRCLTVPWQRVVEYERQIVHHAAPSGRLLDRSAVNLEADAVG